MKTERFFDIKPEKIKQFTRLTSEEFLAHPRGFGNPVHTVMRSTMEARTPARMTKLALCHPVEHTIFNSDTDRSVARSRGLMFSFLDILRML